MTSEVGFDFSIKSRTCFVPGYVWPGRLVLINKKDCLYQLHMPPERFLFIEDDCLCQVCGKITRWVVFAELELKMNGEGGGVRMHTHTHTLQNYIFALQFLSTEIHCVSAMWLQNLTIWRQLQIVSSTAAVCSSRSIALQGEGDCNQITHGW